MVRPDMEFSAVYDGETDSNICTATLRVGTRELVKSEALEGEAAEATKQQMRERLAREMFQWIDEYAPTVMEDEIADWFLSKLPSKDGGR